MIQRVNFALVFLFVGILSLILYFWHLVGMNTQLQIYPNTFQPAEVFSDAVNGGISQTRLYHQNNRLFVQCKVEATGYTHPFCGVTLFFGNRERRNLEHYSDIRIVIGMRSELPDTLMLYLLNREPSVTDEQFERANLRTIFAKPKAEEFIVPLSSFAVPSWWMLSHPNDIHRGLPQINSVDKFRITSGDNTQSRELDIVIESVSLQGKWLNRTQVVSIILGAWLVTALGYLYQLLNNASRHRKHIMHENAALTRLNKLLAVEKQQYEDAAEHDPLTKVLNRRGAKKILNTAIEQQSMGNVASLVLMDIDHFKSINDKHGHVMGDKVLVNIASLIQREIRSTDALIRWGGEEFAIICPHTVLNDAHQMAEKIRRIIECTPIFGLTITGSFGVSELGNDDVTKWFESADQALYLAKSYGRNRTVTSQ